MSVKLPHESRGKFNSENMYFSLLDKSFVFSTHTVATHYVKSVFNNKNIRYCRKHYLTLLTLLITLNTNAKLSGNP